LTLAISHRAPPSTSPSTSPAPSNQESIHSLTPTGGAAVCRVSPFVIHRDEHLDRIWFYATTSSARVNSATAARENIESHRETIFDSAPPAISAPPTTLLVHCLVLRVTDPPQPSWTRSAKPMARLRKKKIDLLRGAK
jgi:hypothetical protein